jgi:hypothetical protein
VSIISFNWAVIFKQAAARFIEVPRSKNAGAFQKLV